MMSPKGIAPIGKQHFAISDVGMKLIFLFTDDGKYVGSFGADGANARFGYPLDISSGGNNLFVADFIGNKVVGFVVNPAAEKAGAKPTQAEFTIRNNLFRDPKVLEARLGTRCLTCHDGLEINSLHRFVDTGKNHPTLKEFKAKIDLPLENGRFVTCSSCHDSHHGVALASAAEREKRPPYMLRKPFKDLCVTCHKTKTVSSANHPIDDTEGCSQCHKMHVSQDYLLKDKVPDMCFGCHGEEKAPQSHPFGADMVNCTNCHSLHDSNTKMSLATHAQNGTATCLSCHEDKKAAVGKTYHLGSDSAFPHPWPQPEAACLDCHDPHKKARPVKQVCSQCHEGKQASHPSAIAVNRAQNVGVPLENGKLTCTSCHDPHLPQVADGMKNFMRNPKKVVELCAGCHGAEKAEKNYKGFHGRKK